MILDKSHPEITQETGCKFLHEYNDGLLCDLSHIDWKFWCLYIKNSFLAKRAHKNNYINYLKTDDMWTKGPDDNETFACEVQPSIGESQQAAVVDF